LEIIRGKVDRSSRSPIYRQIAAILHANILSYAKCGPNDHDQPIPTERELSTLFGVQRATIRKALGELLDRGLLYRIRGKGTFVNATGLSGRRKQIEIVAASGIMQNTSNPFSWFLFYDLFRGVTVGADELDCHCHLTDVASWQPAGVSNFFDYFKPGGCMGVIFFGYPGYEAIIEHLKAMDIPYVVADGAKKEVDINRVFTDREKGISLAVAHLLDQGHRRIALLNGPLTDKFFQERYNGYERALRLGGVPLNSALVLECGGNIADGHLATKDLLARCPEVTGIVAATDLRALGAMDAARECGRYIPRDISIIGYHDSYAAVAHEPPLTTVRLPAYEMGNQAVRLLRALSVRQADPPVGREVAAELVIRGSTAKAPPGH